MPKQLLLHAGLQAEFLLIHETFSESFNWIYVGFYREIIKINEYLYEETEKCFKNMSV